MSKKLTLKAQFAALSLYVITKLDAQDAWNDKTLKDMEAGFQRCMITFGDFQTRLIELKTEKRIHEELLNRKRNMRKRRR